MYRILLIISAILFISNLNAQNMIFEEIDGIVAVEAEHYSGIQKNTIYRQWYATNTETTPNISPDPDGNHSSNASGGAYLEILPDTRVTDTDPMETGSFTNTSGQYCVISYDVYFNNPGKYYVWARAYSTGSEDNGLHVGIDGQWPNSGNKLQWCNYKNTWYWESKQRTETEHCGVEEQIFLEVDTVGMHTISFSMREDGFEFDKWVMDKNEYVRPEEYGPEEVLYDSSRIRIQSSVMPNAVYKLEYTESIRIEGGVPPFIFSINNGQLPQGLSLDLDGLVSGIPLNSGENTTFTVKVKDENGDSASKELNIGVLGTYEYNIANSKTYLKDSDNFLVNDQYDYSASGLWDGDLVVPVGNSGIDSFWVEYDLGQEFEIYLIRFSGDAGGTWVSREYSVATRLDTVNPYSTIIDKADGLTNDPIETEIDSINAKYIRLTVYNTIDHKVEAREFEVFGAPVNATNIKVNSNVPKYIELYQNYPNPFNPETTITFSLKQPSKVILSIYAIDGQLIKKVFDQNLSSGNYEAKWDGTSSNGIKVSSGIYLVELKTADNSIYKKMTLIK